MAKRVSLTPGVVIRIKKAVDLVFNRALARFLGRPPADKKIYIGVKSRVTLSSLFEAASAEEHAKADKAHLDSLLRIAEGFVEAQRHQTKARVVKAVESWLTEAHSKGVKTDVETVLGGELAGVWKTAAEGMHKIVAAESNAVKNAGVLDSVVKFANARGVGDPVVYFSTPVDDSICKECLRLHLLEDRHTPRLWYLSELKHGYAKKGDDVPSLPGQHPRCRGTLATLARGFGFDEGGGITYVAPDHDEMKKQRG